MWKQRFLRLQFFEQNRTCLETSPAVLECNPGNLNSSFSMGVVISFCDFFVLFNPLGWKISPSCRCKYPSAGSRRAPHWFFAW